VPQVYEAVTSIQKYKNISIENDKQIISIVPSGFD
jgi:hypothetical protein